MTTKTDLAFQDVEVFEAILDGQNSLNQKLQSHIKASLPGQQAVIAEGQQAQITEIRQEILDEMVKANAMIEGVRDKIKSNHNVMSAKSCLKSSLAKYLNLLPLLNVDVMTKTLDKDVEICKNTLDSASANFETFSQNYVKYLSNQQKLL